MASSPTPSSSLPWLLSVVECDYVGVLYILPLKYILRIFADIERVNSKNETGFGDINRTELPIKKESTILTRIKRCWNKVIPGKPILARVVVASIFFFAMAIGTGMYLVVRVHMYHNTVIQKILEELYTGARKVKPYYKPDSFKESQDSGNLHYGIYE
ncbi:Hypothetical predicted protein [Pelobates cultripes]|uniref:Uncharacterized protein n=1 Tax=Pelobates cultripes TaxID=61616 RepID=A0AAD1SMZ8_PELCU|nr:Hypothetical predicted protein [Pelobates cultripes]